MKRFLLSALLLFTSCTPLPTPAPKTFTNPLIPTESADPWIILHDHSYYFTATLDPDHGIWIWQSPTLSHLNQSRKVRVYTAPPTGPSSHGIWAPELHFLQNHWYLYFTASDGPDRHHRLFVMSALTNDPLGDYSPPTLLDPARNSFALDPSILSLPDGRLYLLYSDGSLWLTPLLSPTQTDPAHRTKIATPTDPWERHWIEAPEPLLHNNKVFIAYSAGHSGTPHYALGLLTLNPHADPTNPSSWTKSPTPIFSPYFGPDGAVYCVGHNAFTTSPDGKESWIIYHAKDWRTAEPKDQGFSGRTTRAQPFTWTHNNTPLFPHPIPTGIPIPVPSGE